jgi:hypothetical protein
MKIIAYILTLGLLILVSCSKTEDQLNGYWYGTVSTTEFEFSKLVYFEDGHCILNNIVPDSFNYNLKNNKIIFTPKAPGDTFTLNYKFFNDSLVMYRDTDDHFTFKLKYIKNDLITELINESGLDINLPDIEVNTDEIFELDWPEEYKVFIGASDDSIVVKYCGQRYPFVFSTFLAIQESIYEGYDYHRHPIFLFVDRDLDGRAIKSLNDFLRLIYKYKPTFVLKSINADTFNFCKISLVPFSDNEYANLPDSLKSLVPIPPPGPPSLFDIDIDKLKELPIVILDTDSLEIQEYFDNIKQLIEKDLLRYIVVIDIDNVESFDSYIKQYAFIYKLIDRLKDEVAIKEFGIGYNMLDEIKQEELDHEIKCHTMHANSAEINRIKYLLQH